MKGAQVRLVAFLNLDSKYLLNCHNCDSSGYATYKVLEMNSSEHVPKTYRVYEDSDVHTKKVYALHPHAMETFA